jgi:hypothetical protein
MPLLDHFHPPLLNFIPWTTLHAGWATRIADDLNERWLTRDFIAAEIATSCLHPEIDVAAFERPSVAQAPAPGDGAATATLVRPKWQVVEPVLSFAATLPEVIEVRVFTELEGRKLVGVIELTARATRTGRGNAGASPRKPRPTCNKASALC